MTTAEFALEFSDTVQFGGYKVENVFRAIIF